MTRHPAAPRNPIAAVDRTLLSLLLALWAVGWSMIYAVGYGGNGYTEGWSAWLLGTPSGKQTVFIAVSSVLLLATLVMNHRFWRNGAFVVYALTLVALIAVLVFGNEIKGARSWFSFGPFGLQPSEFAKFGTCLAVASLLAAYRGQIRSTGVWLQAAALFVVPAGLILLQPDAGSALVFGGLTLVLYRAGLNPQWFVFAFVAAALLVVGLVVDPLEVATALLGLGSALLAAQAWRGLLWAALVVAGAIGLLLLPEGLGFDPRAAGVGVAGLAFVGLAIYWYTHRKSQLVLALTATVVLGTAIATAAHYLFNNVLAPHQQDRLNVWLQPSKSDPRGSLYNVLQSKMAISSGGFQGKGWLEGTLTKLRYVPEQTTDFIFCTVGEEHGFIGATVVIGLFVALLLRLVQLAERQRSLFAQYYMYGVAGVLFVHFTLNVGMTMGLMPIIGIPLPFISYGGSSLMAFTLILGVALRLDATRTERE